MNKMITIVLVIVICLSSLTYGWIEGGGDATCNTITCNLSDDTSYLFTSLDFSGSSGFDDLVDNTGGESEYGSSNFTTDYANRGGRYKIENFTSDYADRTGRWQLANFTSAFVTRTGLWQLANFTSSFVARTGLWKLLNFTNAITGARINTTSINTSELTLGGSKITNWDEINATGTPLGSDYNGDNFTIDYADRTGTFDNENFTTRYNLRTDRFQIGNLTGLDVNFTEVNASVFRLGNSAIVSWDDVNGSANPLASDYNKENFTTDYTDRTGRYKTENFTTDYTAVTDRFGNENFTARYAVDGYDLDNFTTDYVARTGRYQIANFTSDLADSGIRTSILNNITEANNSIQSYLDGQDIGIRLGITSNLTIVKTDLDNGTIIRDTNTSWVVAIGGLYNIENFTANYVARTGRYDNENFTAQYSVNGFDNENFSVGYLAIGDRWNWANNASDKLDNTTVARVTKENTFAELTVFEAPVIFRDNVTIVTAGTAEVNESLRLTDLDGNVKILLNATTGVSYDNSGGFFGIGTAEPSAALQISKTSNFNTASNPAAAQDHIFLHDDGGTAGLGNFGPSLTFSRIDGTRRSASIVTVQTGTDQNEVGLEFYVHDNTNAAAAMIKAMTIRDDGNVGLNTTNPQTSLSIFDSQAEITLNGTTNAKLLLYGDPSSDNTITWFNKSDGSTMWIAGMDNFAGSLSDYSIGRANNVSDLLIQHETGFVGIGTTTPTAKLNIVDGELIINHSTSTPRIILSDSTDGDVYELRFQRSDDEFSLLNGTGYETSNVKFTVEDDGDMAIGQAKDSQFKLEIIGVSPDDGYLGISSSVNADGDIFMIDTAGLVGIGTQTPEAKLHVTKGDAGSISLHSNADEFLVEDNTAAGISIMAGLNYSSLLVFANEDDTNAGFIGVDFDNKLMRIGPHMTGGSLRVLRGGGSAIHTVFDTDGNMGIGTNVDKISQKLEVRGGINLTGTLYGGRNIFSAYDGTGGLQIPTSASGPVAIPFDTELREGSFYTHSTTGDNSNVTVSEPGWYTAYFSVCIDHNDPNNNRVTPNCYLSLNSVEVTGSDSFGYSRSNADGETCSSKLFDVEMAANDKLQVECTEVGGGYEDIFTIVDASSFRIEWTG